MCYVLCANVLKEQVGQYQLSGLVYKTLYSFRVCRLVTGDWVWLPVKRPHGAPGSTSGCRSGSFCGPRPKPRWRLPCLWPPGPARAGRSGAGHWAHCQAPGATSGQPWPGASGRSGTATEPQPLAGPRGRPPPVLPPLTTLQWLGAVGRCCGPWPLARGPWPLASGPWPLASGPWPLAPGPWGPCGPWGPAPSAWGPWLPSASEARLSLAPHGPHMPSDRQAVGPATQRGPPVA